MESHQLPYRDSYIHYLKFGKGTSFLFCFHGYGEDASSFLILEKALGADYTLIAIDLPYHGQTVWKEGLDFTPAQLQQIIDAIVPLELQTISLLGYSMGGRVALALAQNIPGKINRIVLIAPDGLFKNFWYWLSTHTSVGNKIFDYTMKKPQWFFGGMRLLKSAGLMNQSIFKFAHSYLDDNYAREMLYKRWTTMRKFNPKMKNLTAVLNKYSIPLRMLFGRFDRIIISKRSNVLNKQNNTVQVKTINAGHQLLKEKHAKDIALLFYE